MKIKYSFIILLVFLVAFTSCGEKKKKSYDEMAMSGLTTRTENLKTNLKAFAHKGTLIGQMYGNLTGIGWQGWENDSVQCDLQAISSYRPAVSGYELAGIETKQAKNIDGIPFQAIRKDALQMFRKGGLLIMNWTVPAYQNQEEVLKGYVKELAKFLDNLQDDYGIKAPVVLYLLPVDGKTWYCQLSKDDYIDLYKKIQGLMDDEDVTNVVYGYSETFLPDNKLMERYPDHDVDVINVTYLQNKNAINLPLYAKNVKEIIANTLPFAQDHNNAFGLTTGIESIGDSSVFSETLLSELKQHPIAYLMFGRNQGEPSEEHYFIPYPGVSNTKIHGLMQLVNDDICVFLEKLNGLYLEH